METDELILYESCIPQCHNGYNVVFSGIPEKADFYADNVTKTTTKVQVPVGYEFVNATRNRYT